MLNKLRNILPFIYLAIQVALFVFILFIPAPGIGKNYFNYSVIVIDLLFSLVFILKKKYNYFLTAGLFFTCISDLFLVVLYEYQAFAMVIFSLAQISYGLYLYFIYKNKIEGLISLISRVGISLIITIISIIVIGSFNPLAVFSMIYFVNLLANIVFSFIHFKDDVLLPIGFIFFLLCDIIVGITSGYEAGLINAPELYNFFISTPFDLIWFFYIISQVLITLSVVFTVSLPKKKEEKNNIIH